MLLLDQRGTGRSTPVGALPGLSAAEQAAYLTHFRADSIVRDAECLRRALHVERWSVLGQSFGGMCVVSYLSLAPEGLREAFITGGLPPLGNRIDDVYRATCAGTLARSRSHFDRYPHDCECVRALMSRLESDDVRLPDGDRLTPRRLRQLGAMLGMSAGSEKLHYVLELAPESPMFLHGVHSALPFTRNPLYAILHESCWADGGATRWSAQRTLPDVYGAEPELLTGEHVFAWMFEEYAALAPLREAANRLAEHDWPRLYDAARLMANEVPVAAAIYAEDMYVERAFSEETAAAIRGLRPWLTNELQHDGVRVDGERVLGRLIDMARAGVAPGRGVGALCDATITNANDLVAAAAYGPGDKAKVVASRGSETAELTVRLESAAGAARRGRLIAVQHRAGVRRGGPGRRGSSGTSPTRPRCEHGHVLRRCRDHRSAPRLEEPAARLKVR